MKREAKTTEPANHIAVFPETSIRRVWHNEEWWFALSNVVVVLAGSADPRQYIKKMRGRASALDAKRGYNLYPLALPAPDGKIRETNSTEPTPKDSSVSSSPVHSLPQGGAVQTLAGAGGLNQWTWPALLGLTVGQLQAAMQAVKLH